ncbi:MAG TPA: helix-turn-helix domain-containing protein [Acidimicrobiia bacterium]|nr:helix-turn-helix domain-containing protein [Acidimicrobiia bacterium]
MSAVAEPRSGPLTPKARETRAALLRSAADEFVERGYAAVSVRDLARRNRVTSGAIYGHFRNKADLLAEVVEERIATDLEHASRDPGPTSLRTYLGRQWRNYRSRRALRTLLVEGAAAARTDADVRARIGELQEAKLREWQAIYRRIQSDEGLDPDADMETLVVLLWAAELGLGLLEALDVELPRPGAWGRIVERLVGSFEGGDR